MTGTPCGTCHQPTNGTHICPTCTNRTRINLHTIHDTVVEPTTTGPRADLNGKTGPIGPTRLIPGLATDLDVAITKEARFTRPDGHSTHGEAPLAFNATASDARQHLTAVLGTWAAHTANALHEPHPAYTLYGLAEYLETKLDWIATHPAGADCFDQIDRAISHARRIVDRPADRTYAGPCQVTDCTGELFAHDGNPIAYCTTCRTQASLGERRDDLLDQAHDLLLTAPDTARLLRSLGEHADEKTIRKWAERGRLATHNDATGRTLYRVGDVLVLTAQNPTRQKAGSQ